MIDEDEEDQVTDPDNPGETIKDPEKEPGKELDEDGDGEPDGKIITTPVNAGNLDTIIQEGSGLKVITECRKKEDNAIVDCSSAGSLLSLWKAGRHLKRCLWLRYEFNYGFPKKRYFFSFGLLQKLNME